MLWIPTLKQTLWNFFDGTQHTKHPMLSVYRGTARPLTPAVNVVSPPSGVGLRSLIASNFCIVALYILAGVVCICIYIYICKYYTYVIYTYIIHI